MGAARAVLGRHDLEVERACLFAIVNGPEGELRVGASFPQGDSLASSDLASEAATAYSVKAALELLQSDPPGVE